MCDVDGVDVESFGSEGVGEVNTQRGSADGEMEDLAEGCVSEVFGGQCIMRLGDLLGCSPRGNPDRAGWRGWCLRKSSSCD